jgi:hypothetical protein
MTFPGAVACGLGDIIYISRRIEIRHLVIKYKDLNK